MITRFYVDNYKCLVNFEYKPQAMELIIGANGSGKSTVFEALDKVRQFAGGKVDAKGLFPVVNRTKWNTKVLQTFEIDFENDGKEMQYRLEINLESSYSRVEKEVFRISGEVVHESIWATVEGMRYEDEDDTDPFDDHVGEIRLAKWRKEVAGSPLSNTNQSMMGEFPIRSFGHKLNPMLLCKLNPPLIPSEIGKAVPRLNSNGSNFASYYLYVLQQKQGAMFEVISHLREVLPGFDSFAVDEDFEQGKRRLMVNFKNLDGAKTKGAAPLKFSFDDLSDGQRALIVLYTLLFCALDADTTLVIDEPENYIALRELQPLIVLMEQRIEESGGQILLISHNQEFINMLTDRNRCVRFYRENNGHTRIAAFTPDAESELTAAEIVARGWEDDE